MNTTFSSARCSERGCAVRYRSGPDRLCPLHRDDGDTMLGRMAAFAELATAPGEAAADADGEGEPDGSNNQ